MKVSQVVVKDLEKLMRKAGIRSVRKLAMLAEIDYVYLINAKNGKHVLSQEYWQKIKKVL